MSLKADAQREALEIVKRNLDKDMAYIKDTLLKDIFDETVRLARGGRRISITLDGDGVSVWDADRSRHFDGSGNIILHTAEDLIDVLEQLEALDRKEVREDAENI